MSTLSQRPSSSVPQIPYRPRISVAPSLQREGHMMGINGIGARHQAGSLFSKESESIFFCEEAQQHFPAFNEHWWFEKAVQTTMGDQLPTAGSGTSPNLPLDQAATHAIEAISCLTRLTQTSGSRPDLLGSSTRYPRLERFGRCRNDLDEKSGEAWEYFWRALAITKPQNCAQISCNYKGRLDNVYAICYGGLLRMVAIRGKFPSEQRTEAICLQKMVAFSLDHQLARTRMTNSIWRRDYFVSFLANKGVLKAAGVPTPRHVGGPGARIIPAMLAKLMSFCWGSCGFSPAPRPAGMAVRPRPSSVSTLPTTW